MSKADTHRRCPQCGKNKLKTSFVSSHARICNTCRRNASSSGATRVKLSTEEKRAAHMLSRYGVTPDEVIEMIQAQDGRCAICRTTLHVGDWYLNKIDHSHTHGHVRGILCNLCNATILRAVESTSNPTLTAQNLLNYLRKQ